MNTLLLQSLSAGGIQQILLWGAIILIFYFFMIRPQQKKVSDQKKFRESLQKGTNVVTIGGLHGKITDIQENTVWLEVDRGFKLKFDKSAIASAAPVSGTAETKA
ncbi:preprotein translocase subunit YajC [Adhaeribacter soli]|uniref:Sec translocon accessory complex subunit YajC n=1 Tax=Adhaeribacter soli TaxID=2607655 RepID=A0A5N1IV44_9BACT|nr:preprotein translocase subunit YajC [Adhaeribacter soli]KAA9331809.1 preprotein translocase subunit YajC [Adhaeribacter soli]